MKEIELTITGMTCGHCVSSVKKAIDSTEGVAFSEVELPNRARIIFDETEVDEEVIVNRINATESYSVNQ